MTISKIEAVRSLFSRDSYDKCAGAGVVTWKDGHVTTEEETAQINAEYERLVAIDNYQEPRRKEYPSIADQLDDIYHNGIDGWKATIKVTKDKYSK